MTYLLDTDIVNYLIKKRPSVLTRFEAAVQANAAFVLSPMVYYEVARYHALAGAVRLGRSFDEVSSNWIPTALEWGDWRRAANLWEQRHRVGRPIEDSDLLIAVSALKAGATLVTNNTSHFEGLGLDMENWAAQAGTARGDNG